MSIVCHVWRVSAKRRATTSGVSGRAMPWHDVKSRTIGQQRRDGETWWSESRTRPTAEATGPRAPSHGWEFAPGVGDHRSRYLVGGCKVVKLRRSISTYLSLHRALPRIIPIDVPSGKGTRHGDPRDAPISCDCDPIGLLSSSSLSSTMRQFRFN